MKPTIPIQIEEVIAKFDRTTSPFNEGDVKQALVGAREGLGELAEAENLGAWAEVLEFALTETRHGGVPISVRARPERRAL